MPTNRNRELRELIEQARNRGAFITTADEMGCPLTGGDEGEIEIAMVQITGPKIACGAPMSADHAATVLKAWLNGPEAASHVAA
jgi:hypothetical protein